MLLVKIKNFNALINNKVFLYQPTKNKKHIKKLSKCQETMNIECYIRLLDYSYYKNCYKIIGINLPRQTNASIPQ